MEVEVMKMIPSHAPATDFNFDSASTTPYITAPSSPQRNFFYSAPTSPTRISAFYQGGAIPFDWEERPGTPKSHRSNDGDDLPPLDDFAFDFSGHLERDSLPADELFDGGRIKPLKPPPRFQYDQNHKPLESPKSPRKIVQAAFSPRHRRKEFDPFTAALEQTRKESSSDERRGRERSSNSPSSSSRERNKGSSRSLSPFRVSDLLFDPDTNNTREEEEDDGSSKNSQSASVFSSSFWYKKWKIKDLLLFRSASESRAKEKEAQLRKKEEVKNSSFRSTDSVGSVSSRRRTSGPPISAHELHYTVNRAFSEEMRKRTSLPYKQGLLGCLGFNPTVPEISKPTVSFSHKS